MICSICVWVRVGSVAFRKSTMLSKLSHSTISPSWLLSRHRATLKMTSVPWTNKRSRGKK